MIWRSRADDHAICRAILRGEEAAAAAFDQYNVSLLEQAAYRRIAHEAVDAVVARHSVLKRYFAAPIRNPIRVTTYMAGALAIVASAGALALVPYIALDDPTRLPVLSGFVGLCAVLAAALGWGVSSWVAHRTARAKHTLDIVSARFAQPAFGQALSDFNAGFLGRRIDTALVARFAGSDEPRERAAVQGLRYLVNYFEFISVGVLMGELDDRIVRRTLRGNLNYVYDKCAFYIAEVQAANPRTLEHFTTVRLHYRDV
jgi:hypothetical protein